MDVIYQLVLRLTTAEKTITRNMTGRPTGLWSGGQTMMHRLQILTVASAADDSGTSHDTHGTTYGRMAAVLQNEQISVSVKASCSIRIN